MICHTQHNQTLVRACMKMEALDNPAKLGYKQAWAKFRELHNLTAEFCQNNFTKWKIVFRSMLIYEIWAKFCKLQNFTTKFCWNGFCNSKIRVLPMFGYQARWNKANDQLRLRWLRRRQKKLYRIFFHLEISSELSAPLEASPSDDNDDANVTPGNGKSKEKH